MDIISGIKSEVIQPMATLVIPGSVAIGPYILIAKNYTPKIAEFWDKYPTAFAVIIVLIIIAMGMLLENFGSATECHFWDKKLEKKNCEHFSEWNEYLKLKIKDEYIGQRYLRTILVRMKFELSMAPALLINWVGMMWLVYIYKFWGCKGIFFISFVILGLASYLFYESFQSSCIMAKTRKLLVDAEKPKVELNGVPL